MAAKSFILIHYPNELLSKSNSKGKIQYFPIGDKMQNTQQDRINWSVTRNDAELISRIVDRYLKLYVTDNRLAVDMDITAAHLNGCPLNLEGLLYAKDFDFFHDINGIRAHLDRKSGKVKGCFSPRYSL